MKTTYKGVRVASALTTLVGLFISTSLPASAAIIFQDDNFHEIPSEAIMIDSDGTGSSDTVIQFGNDAIGTENGNITWDITLNTFLFDHSISITGGLSATGNVDLSAATQVRLRQDADPATNATCTNVGEIIVDTTDGEMQICTVTGSPGTWVATSALDSDTLDGLNSDQFLRSDTSDGFTSGTLTFSAGTTLDVNGAADFSGATSFSIVSGAANPGTCTEGQLFYNSTTNVLNTCTAANTWTAAGPQNFEDIYTADGDNTLTTSNGDFNIALGSGELDVTTTGLIDFNGLNFDIDLTGAFTVDAVGASNVTTDSGDLTLSTTTLGDIALSGADDVTVTAGDDIIFDDAQLTAPVQLTDTATGISAEYGTTGIIDTFNVITQYTAGDGADIVGVEDGSLTNIALGNSSSVQEALVALDTAVGTASANNEILSFYPEYPDTVIYQDGTNNRGTLEADYDDTNDEHFYKWRTQRNTAQDIDLRFRFSLPADFLDVNDFTYKYRTGNATEAQNDVEIGLYNATNETAGSPTLCGQDQTNGSANTWTTGTVAEATLETGCTGATALNAGDVVEILVKLIDATSAAATFADIGVINLGYDN